MATSDEKPIWRWTKLRRVIGAFATFGAVAALVLVVVLAFPRQSAGLGAGTTPAAPPSPAPVASTPALATVVCPPTSSQFLKSVCALASTTSDWQSMVVPANSVGPTPQIYAKLAVAVLNKDLSACDDDQILAFIAAGSHVTEDAAHGI